MRPPPRRAGRGGAAVPAVPSRPVLGDPRRAQHRRGEAERGAPLGQDPCGAVERAQAREAARSQRADSERGSSREYHTRRSAMKIIDAQIYSWDPTSNQLALDAARKYPDRFAVMGQFPLDDPESRQRIRGWRNQPGMMGLRWALLYPEQQKALHEGKLDWVWPAAEKEGIPVATMAGLF